VITAGSVWSKTAGRRDDAGVDRFEGPAWLDWCANSTTVLASVPIAVVVSSGKTGWEAHGHLRDAEDADGFAFLCGIDPVFGLRFPDGEALSVIAHPIGNYRRFALTANLGQGRRAPVSDGGSLRALTKAAARYPGG
jgi:hypothetical protein